MTLLTQGRLKGSEPRSRVLKPALTNNHGRSSDDRRGATWQELTVTGCGKLEVDYRQGRDLEGNENLKTYRLIGRDGVGVREHAKRAGRIVVTAIWAK